MRLFEKANYPFMRWRWRAYIVTAVVLAIGFGGMIRNQVQHGSWLNYGVDFTGGTLVQVDITRGQTDVEQLRAAVRAAGHDDWEINSFGDEFVVRMPTFQEQLGRGAKEIVEEALRPRYQDGFQVVRTEAVGAKVGSELQTRALLAILVSFLATLIYLAVRFEWRFGLAAIAATAHDILITLGFLAVIRSEISLGTVAAFLTIVGYSLNDTIVVFDRIRENLGKPRHGMSYEQVLDRSINETLPRTVLTGSTSLATLLSLFIFGGPVIRDFALVLMLGILIGTFSSIFVASPVLNAIQNRWPHKPKTPEQAVRSRSAAARSTRTARTAV
ncbi:MAG TPA: protein translocase subunit SecF [Longimicrobiaceae bacterium]|nr:protein translocase subunit SecF [Longimicrobiaceae bacterium]